MERCSVLILGGGVAGSMAAISAARNGADVVLIERGGCLGGMWTSGLIGITLDPYNKTPLLDEFLGLVKVEQDLGTATLFEIQKYILEKLCVEAGVKILYHSQPYSIELKNGKILAVRVVSKGGTSIFNPAMVIDATGDGDIAALAGCEFDYGRPEDGKTQPMSMVALVGGVDSKLAKNYISYPQEPFWDARNRLKALLDKNGISVSLGCASIVPLLNDIYILSMNQVYGKSGCDSIELTQATIEARREIYDFVASLRKCYPEIFPNISLLSTPEAIGVREGRRIRGKYTVTLDDMIAGKRHTDSVCTVTYWPDIHSPQKDEKGFSDGGLKIQPYDIPFRALIPETIDNLLVAGRCISGDFYAHSSYRVMGNMAAVGAAAGEFAAKTAKSC